MSGGTIWVGAGLAGVEPAVRGLSESGEMLEEGDGQLSGRSVYRIEE